MIGVNAHAGNADSTVLAGEFVGAPGYEQYNWNNTNDTVMPNLINDLGNATGISVNWHESFYSEYTTANVSTPDGKLFRGWNKFHNGDSTIDFSGLAPGWVGLYQVNVEIPSGVPPGLQPLTLATGGVSANEVRIWIQ